MRQIRLAELVVSISFVALVAGCVGPDAGMSGDASGPVAAALPPGRDLTGTWRGSFSQIEASLYEDEANFTLQIKDDGTFSATITRSKAGTNNLAKPVTCPARWSEAETGSSSGARRSSGSVFLAPATPGTGSWRIPWSRR